MPMSRTPPRRHSTSSGFFGTSRSQRPQRPVIHTRANSMPDFRSVIKGILHISTLEDSLHAKYGEHDHCKHTHHKDNKDQHITFSNIEIREYARTVGINPSVSAGPPVTITWDYDPNVKVLSVEDYEKHAPNRRSMAELALPRSVREDILKKQWGIPQSQIAGAVRNTIKTKNQRRTTVQNLGRTDKIEEKWEGATKQLLKGLFLRKSTSKTAEELEQQVRQVERQRRQYLLEHTMKDEYADSATDVASEEDRPLKSSSSPTQSVDRRSTMPKPVVAVEVEM